VGARDEFAKVERNESKLGLASKEREWTNINLIALDRCAEVDAPEET
jgi:hypothetical protein